MIPEFQVPSDIAELALCSLSGVIRSDGEIHEREVRFLDAVARALGREPGPREPVAHSVLAEALTDPVWRLRLVQAAELVVILDGQVSDSELAYVAELSKALDVSDPRLSNLKMIRRKHLKLLQLDLLRRSPMGSYALDIWHKNGLRDLFRYLAQPQGYGQDPDEAWRFKQLGLLPEGTLGREYWSHMTSRRFAFPGEVSGFPAELVRHDLVHVLSGHNTDVPGECENASFIGGFLKDDPFSYVFMVAVHCNLDIEVFPNDPSQAWMQVNPERCVAAFQRGLRVNRDLYSMDWDYWLDMPRSLEEVRADYNIEVPPSA